MILETFMPTERLKPFVKCYIVVDCDKTMVNTMLPDTSLIVGFRFKGSTKYITDTENTLPFAVVAGLRKSIQLMKDERGTGNVLVVFRTSGAAAFFREPLHDMFGEVLSLNEFSNFNVLSRLEDRLCEAKSSQDRINIVETFLLEKLCDHKQDALVAHAINIINTHKGFIRIRDLAAKLCISIDPFEKRFRRATGATPKHFCYIVRMNTILAELNDRSLAQTAAQAGYYDQAHFTKDFKLFTGKTPLEFLKNPLPRDH
jgi:AraC-type DNA-binding domain-containing proteins